MYKMVRKTNNLKNINLNLKVLQERTRNLKKDIAMKNKRGDLNITEKKRILNKIRAAKKKIADAGFI